MEDLLKEMEDYKDFLHNQAKNIMGRIIGVSSREQNDIVRNFTNELTSCHKSINVKIDLIEYAINDLKERLQGEA